MRKQRSQRVKDITQAAMEVLSERGFYGMTIQEVADRTGLSQAGILKYVKNKNGLLSLILEEYDEHGNGNMGKQYLDDKLSLSKEELERSPALMPEWYRIIAQESLRNPMLTQLYIVLRAEALDPHHPAHDYFAQRGERLREEVGRFPWKLPPEFSTPQSIALLSMTVGSAMEGLQSRWLGEPNIDLLDTWAQYENILFPLPHWQGYR
ncbi:TetR/AcrR family transcriptional regulator [Bifidobacterium eulemuris]|uniref:AcrR family transcriptional regulator n=1 Tax=Bifidobacterium eulemuris TaxID=1765219 RepID=A0A261GBI1_9BIFI|nr:TetR/AcrR family transcriptional regulator [Bifidobacterium eulemuris]OZG68603.1 AcrR family transcriptional regulator [Bifidobacterium eulemuris]QOL32728.1 TetR/AcrR family transcriptional regulator [Bifidobacterium eulemuris]